ncbi:hypothetical protein HYPBUDRAFT_144674 [Hyphopichia burtonii NRRL Y-1933]|uniref:GDS1 winged helix domain-containing protein n=1 Tax=Hyphopichia burtonii NRRL Y-1933 TaxID=984485 RepID=A0A1E4RC00_9ASCO|nr:hypothetical protein HYPBUDRAFT_144674 [Hyphopichia burtonii NRRL Y-1933]ODV64798.1 hypothetical protein HYPBUDRAFT_144674 [Hyphopichia burtonii NRRL Y-1933]
MALADRRPLGFPVTSTPASPSFNPTQLNSIPRNESSKDLESDSIDQDYSQNDSSSIKSTINNLKGKNSENDIKPLTPEKSLSPIELSPTTSRSISPDSLVNQDHEFSPKKNLSSVTSKSSTPLDISPIKSKEKKQKNTSRAPIATGISTTIPVTGEKPKPDATGDPSLEDDVLYAIFVILYEKDPDGLGMTVKQICDVLIEQHPQMANLSTKTSNLVSAKLNAYVKRVEKGDSNLKYALSRDWADASPKRMVYVYRGLLAPDFHLHVKIIMEKQKKEKEEQATKQASLSKPRRQTMFDLGVTKHTFLENPLDKSNLFVPYSSAPVTASLNDSSKDSLTDDNNDFNDNFNSTLSHSNKKNQVDSDLDFEDFEVFNDDEDDSDFYIEHLKKNNKRSKSMSYLSNKKNKILTAAAAAPRAPRTPCSHSPNAAAAAAALHAAALKAISKSSESSDSSSNSASSSNESSSKGSPSDSISSSDSIPQTKNGKWLNVVRSGFLTQDIGAPEDLKLSDLDKFFN